MARAASRSKTPRRKSKRKAGLEPSPVLPKTPPTKAANASKKKTHAAVAFHYEFGGPPGALGTMLALPVVILALYYLCRGSCTSGAGFCVSFSNYQHALDQVPGLGELWDPTAMAVVVGWLLFQVTLERCLPCEVGRAYRLRASGSFRVCQCYD